MLHNFAKRSALALLAGSSLATAAHAVDLTALGSGNTLVTVDSATPGTVTRTTAITGLAAGSSLVGIDARPAAGGRVLYGIANTGVVYAINPRSGAASALNAAGTPVAFGSSVGFDFNPTVDRIRVISSAGQNFRVNPNDGSFILDGPLNGSSTVGNNAAAYTNNVAGATTTQLFVINPTTGQLQLSTNPNGGTMTNVGALGVATSAVNGFDVTRQGEVYATLTTAAGRTSLYRVNLQTGAATLVGGFGASGSFQGLAAGPAPFASLSGNANISSVGAALDNYTGIPSQGLVGLFGTLDNLADDGARAAALQQLGPGAYSILPEVVLQTTEFTDSTLRRYLRDARAGGTDAGSGGSSDGTDGAIGGFIVGTGRDGSFDARGDRGRVNYGSTGVIAGVDYRISEKTLIGITGGYDQGEARLTPFSQNSNLDTWFVGGYGTLGFGAFYVDLAGTYGQTDMNLLRGQSFGSFGSQYRTKVDGKTYSGSATTGLSFDLGMFEAEAFGGARYAKVEIDGFSEPFALTALNVADQDVESLQSIAGLRLGADFDALGASVRPSVRGEWRHEFQNDDARLLTANFQNGEIGGAPISYTTTPLGQDYAVVGVGATISGNSPISLVLDYTGQFFGGYRIHSAQVGGRISF